MSKLSLSIIAYNEVDKLPAAIGSVSGWAEAIEGTFSRCVKALEIQNKAKWQPPGI
jgi:hypothetical protein